jgi:methylmalonyl-CoA mutase N-terminal domain/subunit
MLRFHTQTGGSTLTAQQPLNNIIRVAIQALAAVIGGTQSLHTNSYDEALALPTRQSVEIALRTQQIIAYESGVADTIDPMGGSYYVEWLTDTIEEEVWRYLEKIEEMGGMTKAIEIGYIQKEIADSAYKIQMDIENGERIVVGVNKFVDENEEINIEIMKVSEEAAQRQIERLRRFKNNRDLQRVRRALEQLQKIAEKEESNENNIVPYIYQCVKSQATLGEIVSALKEIFGEYRAPTVI